MNGNGFEILALDPTNLSDRLEICFGHLDNWRSLDIVKANSKWLAKANSTFTPSTFMAYTNGSAAGMIEFIPVNQIEKVGFCPCRARETKMKEIEALNAGFDDCVLISCLWVPARHQGVGVGRALLTHFLNSQVFNGYRGAVVYTMEREQRWPKEIHWPAGPTTFYLNHGFDIAKALRHPAGHILSKKLN
jgi:ribosomal protein S18 acetylase RimI-like enzyme